MLCGTRSKNVSGKRSVFEGSEVCDSEVKEMAVARLQQQIESLELQEQELWPVEAEMRQMGVDDAKFARQGAFSRRTDRQAQNADTVLQQTIEDLRSTSAVRARHLCKTDVHASSEEVEEEEDEPDARGRHAGPTAGEGANQAPSPVTPTDW